MEKEMATHSSILAWRIPGTAEPGGLPSVGSHRVRHDWSDLAAMTLKNIAFSHFNLLNQTSVPVLLSVFFVILLLTEYNWVL